VGKLEYTAECLLAECAAEDVGAAEVVDVLVLVSNTGEAVAVGAAEEKDDP